MCSLHSTRAPTTPCSHAFWQLFFDQAAAATRCPALKRLAEKSPSIVAGVAKSNTLTVEQFLDDLTHPRKVEIEELRAAILGSSSGVTEHVKWNAPSFCVKGDDRITFRLQPDDRVELVFHRGAKKRSDSGSFTFADPSGLIEWSTNDRGIVAFRDHDAVRASMPAVVELARRWTDATAE